MKILIIGLPKSKESQLLKQEAEKKNHQIKIIPLSELLFNGKDKLTISTQTEQDIADFDAVLFRAINRHITEAKITACYMKNRKRIVVDEILAKGNYEYHKFFMHSCLLSKNIPQPLTFYALNIENIKRAVNKIKPPFVVKHIKEMHGRSNFRFDSEKEILDFFSQNKKQRLGHYIIQEWHPSKYYYRTLVLNNKVLGIMERISLHCQDRPQIPLSQRSKKAELTSALKKLSLKTAQAMDIEFAGLDIMPDKNNELQVLEINRSPRFKRFTQVTGVNVAEKMINYIEQKINL